MEGNLERALSEEPHPGAERNLTSKEEALLVATACTSPPQGRARWTLELLAGAMVKLTEHRSLTHETFGGAWPKMTSSPGARTCGAFRRSMANTSPAWKTCSSSMPKRPMPSGHSCASTKARCNSSARRVSQVCISRVIDLICERHIEQARSCTHLLGLTSLGDSRDRERQPSHEAHLGSVVVLLAPRSRWLVRAETEGVAEGTKKVRHIRRTESSVSLANAFSRMWANVNQTDRVHGAHLRGMQANVPRVRIQYSPPRSGEIELVSLCSSNARTSFRACDSDLEIGPRSSGPRRQAALLVRYGKIVPYPMLTAVVHDRTLGICRSAGTIRILTRLLLVQRGSLMHIARRSSGGTKVAMRARNPTPTRLVGLHTWDLTGRVDVFKALSCA